MFECSPRPQVLREWVITLGEGGHPLVMAVFGPPADVIGTALCPAPDIALALQQECQSLVTQAATVRMPQVGIAGAPLPAIGPPMVAPPMKAQVWAAAVLSSCVRSTRPLAGP